MAKKTELKPRNFCGDCTEIMETYNKGADGRDILGTCRLDGYAKLLKHDSCEYFKQK